VCDLRRPGTGDLDGSVELSGRVRYREGAVRFAVLLLGMVASTARVVVAAPSSGVSAELSKEFQAGVDAYRLGKYDDARAHLDKAQAIDPKLPGPHRFLAAVARAQHHYAECITETRRAIQLNPQSREIVDTRKLHDECRAADGRPAFSGDIGDSAAIAVTANVTGATVRIGKLRYGGTPLKPHRIKPGVLEIDIEKPGWKTAHVTIEALPAIVTDVEVVLDPVAPARSP
jgi:tetratricopeptide (TPR) repeat protein